MPKGNKGLEEVRVEGLATLIVMPLLPFGDIHIFDFRSIPCLASSLNAQIAHTLAVIIAQNRIESAYFIGSLTFSHKTVADVDISNARENTRLFAGTRSGQSIQPDELDDKVDRGTCQFPTCSRSVYPGSRYCSKGHRECVRSPPLRRIHH